jgi:endonuclease III
MAATNRTDKVKLLVKTLQKRYKHIPKPAERKLLECLMFAACLENAAFEAAESAYSVLEHHYIDWNELRVSTPQEIADTLPMLPQPLEAGERIKKTLQWVFEITYMFDLEDYRKKTIGQTVEYLDSIPSCTPFMTNYLVQIGLGGHQIPVDESALRILRRLDLTKINNGREEVPGLERLVTKNKGIEFATMMHLFGMEFFSKQDDVELLTLLKAIDKNASERSWREPEGIRKKPDTKPIPAKIAAPHSTGFKPVIDLDDEDGEPVGHVSRDESIEFIDTSLAALGAGSKESNNQADGSGVPPKKKQSSGKSDSRKKSPQEQPSLLKPDDDEIGQETVTESASHEPEPAKKEKNAKKETKKSTPPTKDTAKKDMTTHPKSPKSPAKSDLKKSEPQKSTKSTSPPKSATKKLQQKKPR